MDTTDNVTFEDIKKGVEEKGTDYINDLLENNSVTIKEISDIVEKAVEKGGLSEKDESLVKELKKYRDEKNKNLVEKINAKYKEDSEIKANETELNHKFLKKQNNFILEEPEESETATAPETDGGRRRRRRSSKKRKASKKARKSRRRRSSRKGRK